MLGRFCGERPFFIAPDTVHNRSAFCGTAIAVPYIGFPNSIRRADHSDQSSEPKGCHSFTRPPDRIGSRPCRATSRESPMALFDRQTPRTNSQRRLAAENDPWRFRQQSSRVISIQFWYLTSLFTSLSVGSDPFCFTMAICKTCIF